MESGNKGGLALFFFLLFSLVLLQVHNPGRGDRGKGGGGEKCRIEVPEEATWDRIQRSRDGRIHFDWRDNTLSLMSQRAGKGQIFTNIGYQKREFMNQSMQPVHYQYKTIQM